MRIVPEGFDLPVRVTSVPNQKSPPTFAFVGRLASNNRPHDTIKAFGIVRQQFPDARLWVIGTGPMERRLRRQAPTGVEFFGPVTDQEKHDRLARAHALIVTSVREGWGLVVTEAAAVGTPSFGYRVPGLNDSISVSGGRLVDQHPTALARGLLDGIDALMTGMYSAAPLGVTTWAEVAATVLTVATGTAPKADRAQSPA